MIMEHFRKDFKYEILSDEESNILEANITLNFLT